MLSAFSKRVSVASLAPLASRWKGVLRPSVRKAKVVSPEEAVAPIKSNDTVYVHSIAAAPQRLQKAMCDHAKKNNLTNIRPLHLHTELKAIYATPEYSKHFRAQCFFIAKNTRQAVNDGRADFIPCFLQEVPMLMLKGHIPVDVALISLSPPDVHGYCSLGPSVDATMAAVRSAKIVIAQINRHVPRTHGESFVHISEVDHAIEYDEPMAYAPSRPSRVDKAIAAHISPLIPDGACLQTGIGAIPDAVLASLTDRKHLGIHTELCYDGIIPLIEKGVVDNSEKSVFPGKTVASFALGSQRLYDFIHDNPSVHFAPSNFVNNPQVISMNKKFHSLNSCIEVDLTGQIVSDSIGTSMYSGVGGQVDFTRGASMSEGGKAIICLPSTTSKGESRVVPFLKPGAGVTTTRAHARFVATEFGVVELTGRNLVERAKLLISIAHPKHRESLERAAFERFKVSV